EDVRRPVAKAGDEYLATERGKLAGRQGIRRREKLPGRQKGAPLRGGGDFPMSKGEGSAARPRDIVRPTPSIEAPRPVGDERGTWRTERSHRPSKRLAADSRLAGGHEHAAHPGEALG